MEKIKNYKIKDFLQLEDRDLQEKYLEILDLLLPVQEIEILRGWCWPKTKRRFGVKEIGTLKFGVVTNLRMLILEGTFAAICEAISLVTELSVIQAENLGIIEFYGLISNIREQLTTLTEREASELDDADYNKDLEKVNANKRMARFGTLNIINALAGDDITKWEIIDNLTYNVVFAKIVMDKEKNKIQKEIAELQRKK